MAVVVVKKSEITAQVKKPDAIILYLNTGKLFVCELKPVEENKTTITFKLKGRR